ncbi:MAG: MFS transporter [Crocinitomicaceae bacterium]|nr:MFS transporter [Crocinitomicaceae bacterium]|tara:strand:- start:3143 stop:4447 length:1305 start_codon:yes stop_codon:yes gene_type:complete
MKGNKKLKNAWAFYDWANSVYPLVITTAIFPLFYENYAVHKTILIDGTENKIVSFFGWEVINTALVSIITSSYFLLLCFVLPLLSGIADYAGKKKTFLRSFCYLGSLACVGLYFFDVNHLELSMLVFAIAGIGFWSSLVFYNAYLPEIAPLEEHDSLSAKGFSLGYIGSVFLLVICLILVMSQEGDARAEATRWCFVFTGIWWFGFSHITYYWLPKSNVKNKVDRSVIWNGFKELKLVYGKIKKTVRLKRYLASFFVYSMAVQTIMIMAIYFGTKEINWSSDEEKSTGLIIAIIMIQLLAILGSLLLSKLSFKIGNLNALKIVLVLWIVLCLYAYFVVSPFDFYIISAIVGLVMGGVQSLSRSTYSKFIPQDTVDTSSFFSFFDVAEKLGIVIGMASYGFIEQLTGNMRNSIVALVLFFVIGLLLMFFVPKEEK